MAQLIVFDVDGTVLEKGKSELSESAVYTIEKTAAGGYAVMFASGRSYHELLRLTEPLSFNPVLAASDGALVEADGKTVYKEAILKGDIMCIFNQLKGIDGISIEFCAKYLSYIYSSSCELRRERFNQVKALSSVTDIEDDIYKITVYGLNSYTKPRLCANIGDNMRLAYEGESTVEIVLKTADKASAVRAVCDKLFSGKTDIIAVGDGDNDLPVMKMAKLPIAMESAAEHIKNICPVRIKNICEIEKIL